MKKPAYLFDYAVILLIIVFMLGGCRKTEAKDQDFVPFLYFTEKNEAIEGRFGFWNLSEANIQLKKETAVNLKNKLENPCVTTWDGTSNFDFLFNKEYVGNVLFGRDIRIEWSSSAKDKDTYTFWLSDGRVISNIDLEYLENLMDEEDLLVYQGAADYDKEKGIITFIMFESTGKQLYVDSIAADTMQHTWKAFDLPDKSGISPIYAGDSILLDDWLYCAGDNGPVMININNGSYQLMENIEYISTNMFSHGSYDPDGPEYVLPYGVWKEKMIWSVPVYTNNAVVYSYCVFQEDSFLGAFYIDDKEQLHIYDESQSEKVISLEKQQLHKIDGNEYVILPH